MATIELLRRFWKPLAVLLLLLATWLHGHYYGVESTTQRYEYARAQDAKYAAERLAQAEADAREQEQKWSAAFDAAATIQHEELANVTAHRDRLLSQLRTVRVPVQPAGPAHLPEAPADSGQPQAAPDAGQPGLAGEELVGRLAVCDEVVNERNLLLELMQAERK